MEDPKAEHAGEPELDGTDRGRRSLAPHCLVILGLLGCLYLGLQSSAWVAPRLADRDNPERRVIEWRQGSYAREKDPVVGMRVGSLPLRTKKQGGIKLGGKPTVLVFIGDADG